MNVKAKKRILVILSILIFSIIATVVTTFFRYNMVYLPFADSTDVQIVDTTTTVETHDLKKGKNGYVITGSDAYLVYEVQPTYVREAYIAFENSFENGVDLEIFTCSAQSPFSQKNVQRITMGAEQSTAMVPIDMKEDVVGIRVDVVAEEEVVFNLTGIHLDTRQAQSVLEYFHASYFVGYLLVGIFISIVIKYRKKIIRFVSETCKTHREATLIVGIWCILILAVFGLFLIGKYNLTATNFMYQVAPWNSLGVEHLGPNLSDPVDTLLPSIWKVYYSGLGYSTWNSNVALGACESLDVILYPLNWIYLLPIESAILLKAMIEVSIAYFGMCFLMRKMKLSIGASIFSGISYACSSAMTVWFLWQHTDVMMFAPWVFLLGYNLIYRQKVKDALFLGIIVYLMITAGMPAYAAYVVYLLGFFILFKTIAKYKKDIKSIFKTYCLFGMAIVEGVLISFPYLFNLMGSLISNEYMDSRRVAGRYILELEYLRSIFFPYCRKNLAGNINETAIYLGIAGILFIVIAIICFRKSEYYFWLISGVILSILVYTHWLDDIYVFLPAINTSSKRRLVSMLVLVLCILAGIGLDAVWKKKSCLLQRKFCLFRIGAYVAILGWCSWYVSRIYKYAEIETIVKVYIVLLLTIIAIEVMIKVKKDNIRKVVLVCVLAICIGDMRAYMFEYFPRIEGEAEIIPEATDSIRYLQDNTEDERIFSIGNWVLFPNTNTFYGLNSITSHNFVNTNQDMLKMMTAIDDKVRASKTALHGTNVDNYELLKWCGVKYIVTERANKNTIVTEGDLVYEGKDGLNIYELDKCADKLFLSEEIKVYDSNEDVLKQMGRKYFSNTVYLIESEEYNSDSKYPLSSEEFLQVVTDNENYIKANVNLEEKRFLVLNEYDDGKWEVYIDGEKAKLDKVNYLFKAVYVSEGEHVVEFIYDEHKYFYPIILSGAVLLIVLIMLIGLKINEHKKKVLEKQRRISNETNHTNTMLQ